MLGRMIKIFFFLNFVKKAQYIKGVFFFAWQKNKNDYLYKSAKKTQEIYGGFFLCLVE